MSSGLAVGHPKWVGGKNYMGKIYSGFSSVISKNDGTRSVFFT